MNSLTFNITDGEYTNWVTFLWCPPGTFTMHELQDAHRHKTGETPVQVTLTKGFWMMETVVTQGLWEAVTGTRLGWHEVYGLGPRYPAYNVSWTMAAKFAENFDQRLREKYSDLPKELKIQLPTEAQWEYACRAGAVSRFHFGDDEKLLGDYAWFRDNSGSKVQPVAQKKPNAWWLYDMHGNVWEWCLDWYEGELSGGTDPSGPTSGSSHVIRGGDCYSDAIYCRSVNRSWSNSVFRDVTTGFRLALVQ